MSVQESDELKMLMEADRSSSVKVQQAREKKSKMLVQSRKDARAEMDDLRKKKKEEMKEYKVKNSGRYTDKLKEIEKEKEEEIENLQLQYKERKSAALELMMKAVCKVDLEAV